MEALLRERGDVLDPEAFIALRRGNSATRVSLGLVEYILDIDLPDEVWEDETFLKAYFAVVDMVCWANVSVPLPTLHHQKPTCSLSLPWQDLYSYNAEQAKGHSGNNVLTVLMVSKGISLQTACDEVEAHYRTLMNSYLSAKDNLPSFGLAVDEDVARFVACEGHWAKGSIA
jgi:hypothetical protein